MTLQLDNTTVTGNTVTGPTGATLQGGGVYTTVSVTSAGSHVTNKPPR